MEFLYKHKNSISFWAFLSIAFTLPLGISIANLTIILSCVLCLFYFKKEHLAQLKPFATLYPFIFFAITVCSGIFSKNMLEGFSRLDRHLLPLLLTIVFVVLDKPKIDKMLGFFAKAITLTTAYLSIKLINGLLNNMNFDQLIFHDYVAVYGQHPVYYALMILVALLFLFSKIRKNTFLQNSTWQWWTQVVILISGLFFCASKAVLVVFVLIVLMGGLFFVRDKTTIIFAFSVLMIVTVGIFNIEYLRNRFVKGTSLKENIINFEPTNDFLLKEQFDYEEKQEITDLELRILMLKITLYHMRSDGVLGFGYGSGDAQDYLDYYLYSYNLGPNWYQGFNVHNQYLHLLLNYGILVLCLFLLYLFSLFKYAFYTKDYLHLAILFAFCFVFFFEVSLIRNKGIVLFYYFNLLFLRNNTYFENSHIRNSGHTQ